MITVILQAGDDGEALSRSLVPLVEGAMEGVISGVMVFSTGDAAHDEIERICDLSGAEHCANQNLGEVIKGARDKWFLILEAGARLEGDWLPGVVGHLNSTENVGMFALASVSSDKPWWQRIFGNGASTSALRRGCLMPKTIAKNAAKAAKSPKDLARGRAMKVIQGGRIQPAP